MSVRVPIELTQGEVAYVSPEDAPMLSFRKWHLKKSYAARTKQKNGRKSHVMMHNAIIKAPPGTLVDHIDGNGLNNVRENLRFATVSQNAMNQKKRQGCKSKFKGVTYHEPMEMWRTYCNMKHVGYYDNESDAARAYNMAAMAEFGEFARLNDVEGKPKVREVRKAKRRSSFRGVHWRANLEKWGASIMHHGVKHALGYFESEEEAAHAYDKKARELKGDRARLNFPDVGDV